MLFRSSKAFSAATLLLIVGISFHTSAQNITKALNTITTEKIKAHIDYLASDSMKGRNTPSPELELAAQYIQNEFKRYGIKPVNNSYFQHVPIYSLSLGKENSATIFKNGEERKLAFKTDIVPFEMSADTTVKAEVAFVGYGITAPEYGFDDYKGIDVKGRIVFVLSHEPLEDKESSVFNGKKATKYSDISYKVENAIAHGAAGLILVTDPLTHLLILPRGYAWPTLTSSTNENKVVYLKETTVTRKIPVFHMGKDGAEFMMGSMDSLERLQSAIDKSLQPHSFLLKNTVIEMRSSVIETDLNCKNVVGFIKGTDKKIADEVVIIGAHYDHVGKERTHKPGEDYIYNGADDNASGTTAMLSVAEAFSEMKVKPLRSILFIAFTGEEQGLYGSKAYVKAPLCPLNKTVAMLNLDMVSRNSVDSLFLESAGRSPELTQVVKKANEGINFTLLTGSNKFQGGSDHAPFYYQKIPFVFFFAGLHSDYHTVRDNPDLVNHTKIAKVARLVFKTAWDVINSSQYYKVIPLEE
ncbi:MAG TPA: M20/M25/M40 family metallo-hydrolase [Bacteroidales bacterium]|nr:M20/M25/M40 family metallo-hydrolase [Bacteroidales bacterium]